MRDKSCIEIEFICLYRRGKKLHSEDNGALEHPSPQKAVRSSSLEVFKTQLDKALSNLF